MMLKPESLQPGAKTWVHTIQEEVLIVGCHFRVQNILGNPSDVLYCSSMLCLYIVVLC